MLHNTTNTNKKPYAFSNLPLVALALATTASLSFPIKIIAQNPTQEIFRIRQTTDRANKAQSRTLIAQIPIVPVSVSVTSEGYDPYCGAYRARVQTSNGIYSVCYYKEQSTQEMSGSYTLYMYDQENGTWLYFTDGTNKWYTANQPVKM